MSVGSSARTRRRAVELRLADRTSRARSASLTQTDAPFHRQLLVNERMHWSFPTCRRPAGIHVAP